MHKSFECSTTPSSVGKMQITGQTAAQGASVQCMQAIETERSPGRPSLSVTTRRRLMPQGTSFSFLHAVTQALQSMQRSASQRNFILAMYPSSSRSDLTEGGLRFLHTGGRIEAIRCQAIHALTEHVGIRALGIFAALIDTLPPAGKVKRHPCQTLAHPLGHQGLHARFRMAFRSRYPHPTVIGNAAFCRIRRIDLDEHLLFQLRQPSVRARLLAAALV